MPLDTAKMAQAVLEEDRASDPDDDFAGLNPLDRDFFRSPRVNLRIPIVDPVVTRQVLKFMREHIDGLLSEMDAAKTRRSKSLIAREVIRKWDQAFQRWAGMKRR